MASATLLPAELPGLSRTTAARTGALVSQPATFHSQELHLPEQFRVIADEATLLYEYERNYPAWMVGPAYRILHGLPLLMRYRRQHRVLFTGRYGEHLALLQGLLPFRLVPHVLLDVEWPYKHRQWWRRAVSGVLHRLMARGAYRIQVFCEREADNYSDYYGIRRDRFVWVPYCTDLPAGCEPAAEEEDFLFTGGAQNRDYRTLIRAVAGQPLRLLIAGRPRNLPSPLPPNVEVLGSLPMPRFLDLMSRARLVVLSLESGLMRYPGVITYVTALRMGKCVVLNEPHGAASYIRDGETGVLVPPDDPAALRDALTRLSEDHATRRRIAAAARTTAAREFCLARYHRDIEQLLEAAQR